MKFITIISVLAASSAAMPAIRKPVVRADADITRKVVTNSDGLKYWWICEVGFCYAMPYYVKGG